MVFNLQPEQATMRSVVDEVVAARTKFPGSRFLLAVLMEEVGELAKAVLQGVPTEEMRREATQVACVAIRIIEEGCPEYADATEQERLP